MSTAAPADWKAAPAPTDAHGWLARAAEVAAVPASDAAHRDKAAATPYAEVRLLKDSGLVTLLGPVEHGGAGQDWPTAYRVVREVAKADGSIGQLRRHRRRRPGDRRHLHPDQVPRVAARRP
ncbi:acyl-CoA dehydrogenase family protein [Streptomyces iakyrus]|uniref:acyl-CoA dehydrogenase family protein n=1 Tax=Streptomyces iakyrus TaxID=68219 RepID=UPI003F4B5427